MAGGPGRGWGRIVERRRAVLDDAHRPPQLRAPGDQPLRHRRLLDAKQRADAVIDDTSAELARGIGGGGGEMPGARGGGIGGGVGGVAEFFSGRQPAMGRLTVILVLIAAVLIAPRLLGVVAAGLAGGAGLFVAAVAIGAVLYIGGGRWFAGRRAEIAGADAAATLDQLAADSRARLQAIIDEWFRIDDTLGIGTALESAYAREPQSPELDRARQSIIASIDSALADGHDALADLRSDLPGADLHQRLQRIDAADRAFLRLRFYRRALDD
ncbi:hypothetical protein ACFWGD_03630 [Corynebacterium sp. NPDC060344]|uniref:hypothetical protein n=1 Tax=Corynebacterium sp. NPDC060344 TaxID=3347101 RepID=UPI003650B683